MLISVAAEIECCAFGCSVCVWELLLPGEQAQAMTECQKLKHILHVCSLAYQTLANRAKKQKELEFPWQKEDHVLWKNLVAHRYF